MRPDLDVVACTPPPSNQPAGVCALAASARTLPVPRSSIARAAFRGRARRWSDCRGRSRRRSRRARVILRRLSRTGRRTPPRQADRHAGEIGAIARLRRWRRARGGRRLRLSHGGRPAVGCAPRPGRCRGPIRGCGTARARAAAAGCRPRRRGLRARPSALIIARKTSCSVASIALRSLRSPIARSPASRSRCARRALRSTCAEATP